MIDAKCRRELIDVGELIVTVIQRLDSLAELVEVQEEGSRVASQVATLADTIAIANYAGTIADIHMAMIGRG